MEGIWRSNFTAGCLWLSASNSRRASRRTRLQQIQLLIEPFGANPNSWFHDLGQPLGAMTWSVDGCAAAGNRPAAVQSFDPIHDAGHILGDRQITAPQFFQGADPMLSVVDGMELVAA